MTAVAPDGRTPATRGAWLTPSSESSESAARRRNGRRAPSVVTLVFVVGLMAILVGLAVTMAVADYDIWGAFLVGVVLLILTVPLATRAARAEGDPRIGRIVLAAALLKLTVGSISRYVMAYGVYGTGDSEGYFLAGRVLAPNFRHGDFSNLGDFTGTRFINIASGVAIAIINETRLGLFVLFSFLAFLGLYCYYQAFRLAFPDGDCRRYRLLLFFWPSLLFWPSSLGKDSWMVCVTGLCALGIANLLVGKARGFLWLAVGTAGCVIVRPHMALLVFAGFGAALLVRRNRGRYDRLLARPGGTVMLMLGAVVVASILVSQAQAFFNVDSLDIETAQTVIDTTIQNTSNAHSSFKPPDASSPVGYLAAIGTVLFRPLPLEVPNAGGAIAAVEGLTLAALVVVSWRRLLRVPKMMIRNAYVAFALVYTAAFIFAFSSFGNFGVLARQRSQLFPLLFVLFALPKAGPAEPEVDETAADETLPAV